MTTVTHLECSVTGERYEAGTVQNLSRTGMPLLVRYDLPAIAASVARDDIAMRPRDLWRWRELLPVRDCAHIVSLGEIDTPLIALDVYEHAYFLDFQTDRGAYIDAFFANLDWRVVNGWIASYAIPAA